MKTRIRSRSQSRERARRMSAYEHTLRTWCATQRLGGRDGPAKPIIVSQYWPRFLHDLNQQLASDILRKDGVSMPDL